MPRIAKSTRLMTKVGSVVQSMERTWSFNFEPATAGARLVVSESGLNLSPNMAPQMTAPATMPRMDAHRVADCHHGNTGTADGTVGGSGHQA